MSFRPNMKHGIGVFICCAHLFQGLTNYFQNGLIWLYYI